MMGAVCFAIDYLAMVPDRMIPDLWLRGFRRDHNAGLFVGFLLLFSEFQGTVDG